MKTMQIKEMELGNMKKRYELLESTSAMRIQHLNRQLHHAVHNFHS